MPDKGIPEEAASGARCIAVVPHLLKGAFIFGGEYGQGVVTCRTSFRAGVLRHFLGWVVEALAFRLVERASIW